MRCPHPKMSGRTRRRRQGGDAPRRLAASPLPWPPFRLRALRPPHPRRTWACAARHGRSPSPTCWRRSRRAFSKWNAQVNWRGWKRKPAPDARRKLEEPDPLPGIAPATKERSRLWDPTITVARDIRARPTERADRRRRHAGQPAGAHDARPRPAVRRWQTRGRDRLGACPMKTESGRPAKIVLLAGRPLDLIAAARPALLLRPGRAPLRAVRPAVHAEPGRTGRNAAAYYRNAGRELAPPDRGQGQAPRFRGPEFRRNRTRRTEPC